MNKHKHILFLSSDDQTYGLHAATFLKHKESSFVFEAIDTNHLTHNPQKDGQLRKTVGASIDAHTMKHVAAHAAINQADIIVCLNKQDFDILLQMEDIDSRKCQVWDVQYRSQHNRPSAQILNQIESSCERLHDEIERSWVDVIDENGKKLGFSLPIGIVKDKGLWHRGVHCILFTHDHKVVVERRSDTIVFSPGRVEVSLGGAVDEGDSSLHAVAREAFEELGISLPNSYFTKLWTQRWHTYHPKYHKLNRNVLDVYMCVLPPHVTKFILQDSEVSKLSIVSVPRLRIALRRRYLRKVGPLDFPVRFYDRLLRISYKKLKQTSF